MKEWMPNSSNNNSNYCYNNNNMYPQLHCEYQIIHKAFIEGIYSPHARPYHSDSSFPLDSYL